MSHSSATRAQVWFELRSSGLGVLVIGLAIASLTPLVFAVTVPVVWFRPFAISWAVLAGAGGAVRRDQLWFRCSH